MNGIASNKIKNYPSFQETFFIWVKVAVFSFGGPANQIAVMHRCVVEEKKWISESRFLHALNYCMLLPGPEAHQLAIYIGWLLYKVRGGILAGILFVLPGFLSILVLSILYAKYQATGLVQTLFYGIKPAVIAIVLLALIRIGQKVLHDPISVLTAISAFIAIFLFNLPFPFIILAAFLLGLVLNYFFDLTLNNSIASDKLDNDRVGGNKHIVQTSFLKLFVTIFVGLMIWWIPIIIIIFLVGYSSIFTTQAIFFSKTAMITFGGAYAVLAYIAQQAVQYYGWLKPGEMLDGLGMAETTPGPLIQVVQFVGFLAAYRSPEGYDPLWAGILGSIITTWVTFVPSFLWIFAGAPYIEKLQKLNFLTGALNAITAAVTGVILNLSLWFAMNTLFQSVTKIDYGIIHMYTPVWSTYDIGSIFIMLVTMILAFRFKQNIFIILLTGILLGLVIKFFLQ